MEHTRGISMYYLKIVLIVKYIFLFKFTNVRIISAVDTAYLNNIFLF